MRPSITAVPASAHAPSRTPGTRRLTVLAACLLATTAPASAFQLTTPVQDGYRNRVPGTLLVANGDVARPAPIFPVEAYTGRDSVTGVPRYITRTFTADEQRLLREHFGVDDPGLLYRSDEGFIVYDSRRDAGRRDYVNTHRVGGLSARLPRETYRGLEARVRGKPAEYFGPNVRHVERRIDALDPDVREPFRELLAEANRRGLRVAVLETYRSSERQAYLLGRGGGITHTATSMHADRRAVDFRVADGDLRSARTRAAYTEFRALAFERGFALAGDWDPGHVALPNAYAQPGFTTIEAVLDAAVRAEAGKHTASPAGKTM